MITRSSNASTAITNSDNNIGLPVGVAVGITLVATSGCGPGLLWVMVSVEVSQQQEAEKGKCFTTVRGACKAKWVFPDREPGIWTCYTPTEEQLIAACNRAGIESQ